MKQNNFIQLIFIIVLLLGTSGCVKDHPIICLDCKAPIVKYSFVSPTDTVTYAYALQNSFFPPDSSYYSQHGYRVYIDTIMSSLLEYNICYNLTDYNTRVYPGNAHFFDTYCVKQ